MSEIQQPTGVIDGPALAHVNGQAADRGKFAPRDEHSIAENLPKLSTAVATLIVLTVAVLIVALFFAGWIPHSRRLAKADADAAKIKDSTPIVETIAPKAAHADEDLTLPGDVHANQTTAIFARATGYLKPLPAGVDIGAHVQEGQLMAEIASPELDAQLDQAHATLLQTRASVTRLERELALNKSTRERYETAFATQGVSQQELDERRSQESVSSASLDEARANVVAGQAAVKRLSDLQQFEKVVAPFSGTITARNFDAGAAISANETATGKELFRIEQVDVLRVQAFVPQGYATSLTIGQPAQFTVKNFPGHSFPGTLARSTGAIDLATRTMRVEVDIPNKERMLLPGMYGEVMLNIHSDHPAIVIPSSALVIDAKGIKVATLVANHVRYEDVTLGRDFGNEVEVVTGLKESDEVINNPGLLPENAEVRVKKK